MSWIVESKSVDRQLAKAESQRAIIVELVDLGIQKGDPRYPDPKTGLPKTNHKVMITYELLDDVMESGDHKGEPLLRSHSYTMGLYEKSDLTKVITAARGRPVEKDEKVDIMKTLLGKPIMVQIMHYTRPNGDKGEKIAGVSAPHKTLKFEDPFNTPKVFRLDEFDQTVYDSLQDWKKKLIDLNQVPEHLRPKSEF